MNPHHSTTLKRRTHYWILAPRLEKETGFFHHRQHIAHHGERSKFHYMCFSWGCQCAVVDIGCTQIGFVNVHTLFNQTYARSIKLLRIFVFVNFRSNFSIFKCLIEKFDNKFTHGFVVVDRLQIFTALLE